MNGFQILTPHPWIERLGLTLLHFLWQGTIIVAMYAAARRWAVRRLDPNGRYLLGCAALAIMAIVPIVSWVLLGEQDRQSVARTFTAPMSATRTDAARSIFLFLPADSSPAAPAQFLSWVVAFWLIGASALSLRLVANWVVAESLRWRMVRVASAEWQSTLDRLRTRLAVSRPVRLLVSGSVDAPAAVGWLRPIVLVPVGALTGLPPARIEALLLHELAHIRRHDYLINILQSALEALFFYHPAVWWISNHMRAERELCCDDIAVSVTGNKVAYARALAEFVSARSIQPAVVASNGGSVSARIARLLGHPSNAVRDSGATLAVPALILVAIGACALFAQPAGRPQFDVASIKPSFSERIMNVRPLPGHLTADATLLVLMQYAYGVQPFQVIGGPGWVRSERYQIEANAGAAATRDRMFLMLRSLLEDRFQLKTHSETRDLPIFALVAAKSGLKLPPPREGACVDSADQAAAEWAGGRMAAPGELPPAKARCGSAIIGLGAGGAQINGGKIAMPELVRTLSMALGRTVIDRTGFTGLFDLQLNFLPDDLTPSIPPPPPDSGLSGPPLTQALAQQLGLHLESTKGPVPVIVLDQAERPSAN